MESKLMSIEEANQMLPLLRKIAADISRNWELIIFKRTELECLEKGIHSPSQARPATREERDTTARTLKHELNYLIDKINSYIREVEELGCFVEEFKRGVINFPSLYNGRKVFLCWKPDEESVGHWHELDESFNDRLPIRDLSEFLCQNRKVS